MLAVNTNHHIHLSAQFTNVLLSDGSTHKLTQSLPSPHPNPISLPYSSNASKRLVPILFPYTLQP